MRRDPPVRRPVHAHRATPSLRLARRADARCAPHRRSTPNAALQKVQLFAPAAGTLPLGLPRVAHPTRHRWPRLHGRPAWPHPMPITRAHDRPPLTTPSTRDYPPSATRPTRHRGETIAMPRPRASAWFQNWPLHRCDHRDACAPRCRPACAPTTARHRRRRPAAHVTRHRWRV